MLNNIIETHVDVQFDEYTFPIRSFYRDLGSEDYSSIQKHTTSSALDNGGGADIRMTTISADNQARAERPRSDISNSIIRREPHENATRSGRLPIRRFFEDEVVQLVIAMLAVYLELQKSTSLSVPSVPFKALSLKEALLKDA